MNEILHSRRGHLLTLIFGLVVLQSQPALSDSAEIMGQIEDQLNFCEHDVHHAAHFSGTSLTIESYLFSSQNGKPTLIYQIPMLGLKYSKQIDGSIFFQCKTPGCVQLITPGLLFGPPTIERRTTLTLSICDIDTNAKVPLLINQLLEVLN
ncbi:hypothetical protein [Bradyrhizobium diazoefficiens]|uniref:hypothetical protein n=1 Tax=Bradyrhizobium diazoefficiens TaxID=1355477 RepID=UPI0038379332